MFSKKLLVRSEKRVGKGWSPDSSSLDFDGTNDVVKTSSAFQATLRDSFTIAGWIKPDDGQPDSAAISILGAINAADEDDIFIQLTTGGKLRLHYAANNDDVASATDAAVFANGATVWTHFAITVTKQVAIGDAQILFYVNGSLVASSAEGGADASAAGSAMAAYTSTTGIFLGARNNNGTADEFFDGRISELVIYSTALDYNEVRNMYNGGHSFNHRAWPQLINLQAWWRMGDGSLDDFGNYSGLIIDEVTAKFGTVTTPILSDNGDYDGADASNWILTASNEWTVITNSAASFSATTDSDISGATTAQCKINSDNSGMAANLPIGIYKVGGTIATSGTLPNTECKLRVYHTGSVYTDYTLTAGVFVIYIDIRTVNNATEFRFTTSTQGHNFTLSNVIFEVVSGNPGVMYDMDEIDIVGDAQ